MAQKVGVICKSCGQAVEVEDEYIPGILGTQLSARLYRPFYRHARGPAVDLDRAWQTILVCGNPGCRKTYQYGVDDLRLFYDSP